jgi:hypothetical protein
MTQQDDIASAFTRGELSGIQRAAKVARDRSAECKARSVELTAYAARRAASIVAGSARVSEDIAAAILALAPTSASATTGWQLVPNHVIEWADDLFATIAGLRVNEVTNPQLEEAYRGYADASNKWNRKAASGTEQAGGRTLEQFAIEFGEYLAKSSEQYLSVVAEVTELSTAHSADADSLTDAYRALKSAIYEFRKRANRAAATPRLHGENK